MDRTMVTLAFGLLVVLGLSALACGFSDSRDAALLYYFEPGSSGDTCDGSAGSCDDPDEFCVIGADAETPNDQPPTTSCGDDWSGRCVQGVKQGALEDAPDQPVCGCDRNTYGSPREAHDQGVSIDHYGECDEPDDPTTCSPNYADPDNEMICPVLEDGYCHLSSDQICASNELGECRPKPDLCPTIRDPVCGCNDTTYRNRCAAHRDGVAVGSEGACSGNGSAGPSETPNAPTDPTRGGGNWGEHR